MPDSSEVIYSDFDNQFITNPITKSLNKKVNRDAVKQAVKNLILTDYYERPFNSDLGCNIRGFLFEPFTSHLQEQMKQAIINVIEKIIKSNFRNAQKCFFVQLSVGIHHLNFLKP